MLVVAVIAIIGIPQFLDARKNANEKTAVANLSSFITDQESYKTENQNFGTILQLATASKRDLSFSKVGCTFMDLFKADFSWQL